jgi:large conductance mechanosensitive channel
MLKDFKAFLIKQNILALAIAVVVGTALNGLVKAVVDGFIMPFISAATPSGDWQKSTWSIGPLHFGIGIVLAALLNFIIVGFVAWRVTRAFIKEEPKAATKVCDQCRMTIDAAAKRCPHCTTQLIAA